MLALALELGFQRIRIQRERADVVDRRDLFNRLVHLDEAFQLGLVVVQTRLRHDEFLVGLALVLLPHPVVGGEGAEVVVHRVADALDAAREQQSDADNFDVLGDALEKRRRRRLIAELAGDDVPILDGFKALQNGLGAAIDALLNIVERRLQNDLGRSELDHDLEERPRHVQKVRAHARCDALLQRVHRILRAVEQRLVHKVIVVLLELGDLVVRDAFHVAVELVGRDDLY